MPMSFIMSKNLEQFVRKNAKGAHNNNNDDINTVKPYLTATSLLQPLFWGAWQNGHTFCKKPSLIRSPINMTKIFWPTADCMNGVPL